MDEREQEIIKRAVGGDLVALKWLFERYAGLYAAIALSVCQDARLARMAARVSMVKTGVEIRRFPREKEDIARWIARVVRHEAERFMAQHRDETTPLSLAIAQDELRQAVQQAGAPDRLDSKRLNELVLNVVLALPKEERELILLRYIYIPSYTEIGRVYGWDRYKVDERLAEARRKLWDALEAFSIGLAPPAPSQKPKPEEPEKKEDKKKAQPKTDDKKTTTTTTEKSQKPPQQKGKVVEDKPEHKKTEGEEKEKK